jgi:hypothetical protein|tara:strand:- start:2397 stop:2621 length:225 start_codon:yes stop_codon:yes gene_type:complete
MGILKMETKEFDIKEIRKVIGELQHNLNWYHQRGGLLPYDWNNYGHPKIIKLLELCKIGNDGHLKKKDKRGSWR